MIDEKKIKAATDVVFADVLSPKANICMSAGFIRGIEWFKEAIWHNAKEEPEEHKFILVQWLHEGEICYEADRTQPKVDWQNHVAENNIIKWCYVDDTLPKGGKK